MLVSTSKKNTCVHAYHDIYLCMYTKDGGEVSLEGARVAPAAKDGGAPCGVCPEGAHVVWFQPLMTRVYVECDLYNTRSQTALELQKL